MLALVLASPVRADEPKPSPPAKESAEDAEARKKLEDTKGIKLAFADSPLTEVTATLEELSGLCVLVDPGIDSTQTVTIKANAVDLKTALKLLAAQLKEGGATFQVWSGAVWLTPGKNPFKPKIELTDAGKKHATTKVTLNFVDTPIREVAEFLKDMTDVPLAVGAGVDAKVTLRAKDATVGAALAMLCRQARLHLKVEAGKDTFVKAK
jgi:type II secretory pathway component GspD/PulD (secretin)